MKKTIKTGHMLTLCAFVLFPVLLIIFDFTPIQRGYTYSEKFGKGALELTGEPVREKKQVGGFSALSVRAQFIDSVILIPSEQPFVEITGDRAYYDNIEIEMDKFEKRLHIKCRKFYKSPGLNKPKNTLLSEKEAGLIIRVGYLPSLNDIEVSPSVKNFRQNGLLQGHRIQIDIEANEAYLMVDANYLHLNLLKPGAFIQFDSINSSQYNQYIQQVNEDKIHTVKGKVDLVEVSNINACSHIYLDLSQLHCRQVHAKMETSDYNKLIVSPSQLFSYITPQAGRFFFKNDLICTSKAKVIHGYRTPEGIIQVE